MKFIKTLIITISAAAFLVGTSAMAESCCVKAKAAGKDCTHPCCVTARKDGKTCEKCQADASCCDKAIAAGKSCEHKCCATATAEKKVCTKCNPEKKKEDAK